MIYECNTGLDCAECPGCDSQLEPVSIDYGFNDTEEFTKNNPGNKTFYCEFCGIYTASRPRCSKCEEEW